MRRAPFLLSALLIASGPAGADPQKTAADYVRGQIVRCWIGPADASGIGAVIIRLKLDRKGLVRETPELAGHEATVRIQLDDNGTVVGPPRIVATPQDKKRAALVQSAIRAIRKCSPFPKLVELAPYDSWKEMTITFDPSKPL